MIPYTASDVTNNYRVGPQIQTCKKGCSCYSQLASYSYCAENYIAVICMIWVNALGCIIFMPFIIVGETSIIILITTQTQSLARYIVYS